MFEWKISTSRPSSAAWPRIRSSYCGRVIGPKISVCTLPRMFMPAPWMTRIRGIGVLLLWNGLREVRGGHEALTRRSRCHELERQFEARRLVACNIVQLVHDDIIAGRGAAHVQLQDDKKFHVAAVALRRDPHEVLFFGKHFAIARLDLKIHDKAEFKQAVTVFLPAVAHRLGIGDDPLAFLEFAGRVLVVKPVTARFAFDEGCLTYRQRRLLPSLNDCRLPAVDFLQRLRLGGADTQQHPKGKKD